MARLIRSANLPSATIREFIGILRSYWVFNAVLVIAAVLASLIWVR